MNWPNQKAICRLFLYNDLCLVSTLPHHKDQTSYHKYRKLAINKNAGLDTPQNAKQPGLLRGRGSGVCVCGGGAPPFIASARCVWKFFQVLSGNNHNFLKL